MTHLKKLQRSVTFAGSLLLAAFGAQAAGNFSIQNGTWIVTSEINGEPGRGMAIDVQDGTLVMQVYNYEKSGQPTFHLSFGTMDGNHYSGTLTRYKNGRYFGSGPLDGAEDGQAGSVQIDFKSASTGTIQFPGEQPVAIERFNFDMIPPGTLSRPNVSERWLLAELDETDKPVNALLLNTTTTGFSPGPMNVPALSSAQSFKDGTASSTTCSYASATQRFKCDIQFDGTSGKRTLQWTKHLEGMSGTISGFSACMFSPCPPTTRRVVGMRLGLDSGAAAVDAQMDAPAANMAPPFYHVAPDPGTWIVSSELTGKPGRGMAIDVQYDTLVMQVYNYEKSGAATFHLAIAPYKDGQASSHLKRYEGGRYFGSGPLSGHEAVDAGAVSFNFTAPTRGTIQFPGEPAVAIQRYQFGATEPALESLYGGWMFFDPAKKILKYFDLDHIYNMTPPVATGSGGQVLASCRYTGEPAASVLCEDKSPVIFHEMRFTPVNGRAIGNFTNQRGATAGTPVYVLRVKDRNGNLAGLGKF